MYFEAPVRVRRVAVPEDGDIEDGAEVTPDPSFVPPARDEQFDADSGGFPDLPFDLPFEPPFGLTDEQAVAAGGGGLFILLVLLLAI
jgi:hypothetical protein